MRGTISCAATSVAAMLMTCGGAYAADFGRPIYQPPIVDIAPMVHPWTGFYVGGNLGANWSDGHFTETVAGKSWSDGQGEFTGGGQLGFNYQFSNIVLGMEGSMHWTSLDVTSPLFGAPLVGTLQGQSSTDWIGTLAGRVGFAADNWLLYGKFGGAWAHGATKLTNVTTGVSVSDTNTTPGWLAGGGIEYAVSRNWSARIEYDYIWLDDRSTGPISGNSIKFSNDIQLLTFGINYKF
jgi:outer membrane immunogenic protein